MTRNIGNGIFIIAEEPPGECYKCNDVVETRPYGPNGEEVCYPCGMLDPETTKKKFNEAMGFVDN